MVSARNTKWLQKNYEGGGIYANAFYTKPMF